MITALTPVLLALSSTAPLAVPLESAPPPASAALHPAAGQDDEKPDKRPEIKEFLDQLSAHAGKRGKEDQEAIQIIDKLYVEFENCGTKDRGAIVKEISKCLKVKRTENSEGVRDSKLYMAAATAMGDMGPESAKPLIGWIDHKQHRKDMALQRTLILSLGKTQHKDAIKPLVGLLPHKEAAMQGAAAEALGGLTGLEQNARKDVFESVLKVVTSVQNRVDSDPNDIIARERFDVIKAPMVTALQLLSGHDERDPTAWQRWWNKNKKRNWDEEV